MSPPTPRLTGRGRAVCPLVRNRAPASRRRPEAEPTGRPATHANGRTTPPGPHAGSWRGVKRRAILPRPRLNFLSRRDGAGRVRSALAGRSRSRFRGGDRDRSPGRAAAGCRRGRVFRRARRRCDAWRDTPRSAVATRRSQAPSSILAPLRFAPPPATPDTQTSHRRTPATACGRSRRRAE